MYRENNSNIDIELIRMISIMTENEKSNLLDIAKKMHTNDSINYNIPIGNRNITDDELFNRLSENKKKTILIVAIISTLFIICLSTLSFVLIINENPKTNISDYSGYQLLVIAMITGLVGLLLFIYTLSSRRFINRGIFASSSKHKQLILDAFMLWLNISVNTKIVFSLEPSTEPLRIIQTLKDGQIINSKQQLALKNLLTINNGIKTDNFPYLDKEISLVLKECKKVANKLNKLK